MGVYKEDWTMANGGLMNRRFKEVREQNSFTQGQLAKFLEVDQSYISKFEKGERNISVDILEKVCDLFGCTLEFFKDETVEYKPLSTAFRANNLEVEDLETISNINKIALNMRFINKLLEGIPIEK